MGKPGIEHEAKDAGQGGFYEHDDGYNKQYSGYLNNHGITRRQLPLYIGSVHYHINIHHEHDNLLLVYIRTCREGTNQMN